jgi:hypothetical protein
LTGVAGLSIQACTMADEALLTLRFSDGQTVRAFAGFLASLDLLYQEDLKILLRLYEDDPVAHQALYPRPHLTPYAHALRIQTLHINSPGLLEVIGALNPLSFIHNYTKLILDHTSQTEGRLLSYIG